MDKYICTRISPTFKSSLVNIVSTADNHGDLLNMPQMVKAIQANKKDLFEKSSEKSTMNMFAIAGDFFMNPSKKGFLTNPDATNGDIQYNFLTKIIHTAKMSAGMQNNFEAVYTAGNHCFDGGDEWLFKKLKKAPMTTILTNVDRSASPLANNLIKERENITGYKVISVPDSKNPKKHNKVLLLGVTIPSMNYYNPGLLEQTKFLDNSNKNDALLDEKDLKKTINVVKYSVKRFKKANPDGAVVVLSHTGNKISGILAEKVPDINIILNGHDHKEFETVKGKTFILSHGQNSHFIRGVQLKFNDNGKLSEIRSRKIETDKYDPIARKDKKIQKFLNANLEKDLVPIVHFKNDSGAPEELVLDESIKYSNNVLANYITSGIKRAVRLNHPDIDAVGIPSTIFRNGLKSNERRSTFNNLDLMKMFDGVSENLSKVEIGSVTGEDLHALILENTLNNLQSKTRNAMIQWSDIQVNRTLIKSISEGKSNESYQNTIKIRNQQTKKFEPIDFNKKYKILMSDKYLVKDSSNIKVPAKIRDNFEQTNETYDSLFRKYLKLIKYDVKITNKTREDRIL
jgi:2',3'-cyclic-nucleotide 2'-phosphodiesterase (5'-nucleotidase family)